MRSQQIYPFCSPKTDIYQDLGWNVEETWRGYKHWDRMQTGIRFRVSIIQILTTNTMML